MPKDAEPMHPLVFLVFLVLVAALVWGALVTPFSMEPPPR